MTEAKKAYQALASLHQASHAPGNELDKCVCDLHHRNWIQPGSTLMFEVTHKHDKSRLILFRDGSAIAYENETWKALCADTSKQFVSKMATEFSSEGGWKRHTTAVLCLRDTMKVLKPKDLHMIYENHTAKLTPVPGFGMH